MNKPTHHIFVCTSSRVNGTQSGFCCSHEAVDIVSEFIEVIESEGLSGDVMVSNTGCFGLCNKGPIVVIYPEGVWYGNVTCDDVEEIVESIEDDSIVKRLEI